MSQLGRENRLSPRETLTQYTHPIPYLIIIYISIVQLSYDFCVDFNIGIGASRCPVGPGHSSPLGILMA
jgi:hypothetical protein